MTETANILQTARKYSPSVLNSYDGERHISVEDAKNLISSQGLSSRKISRAINGGEIELYSFGGISYLDRIDMGRIYASNIRQQQGLTIDRYFTEKGQNPFETVEYRTVHLQIKDKEGESIFDLPEAVIPEWMDDVSASIVAQKYFYTPHREEWKQKIRDKLGTERETSLVHLNRRVTNFFVEEGDKLGYFADEESRESFRDELNHLQAHGMFAFNSPVQFNAGIFIEYGIEGSRGIGYWKNPETGDVKKIERGEYIHPQCHACFIKGPRDDLESIAQHTVDEIGIFSNGSGIGQDIGRLRASGEKLSSGGKSSGPIDFWRVYDRSAGTIKSGGKSRRAARMTTMRQGHPDILEFIRSKVREDRKALTLIEDGYESGMDGEAYQTVAFQNTNISVRLDNYFFDKLMSGGEIELRNVVDGKVVESVNAQDMLKEISFGSWRIGDPAVQYETIIQEMHTAKNSGRINSSNPCSEYMFLDDTSCNLASLKLTSFVNQDGSFNVEDFRKATRIVAIAQDIANNAASYPVKEIALQSPEFRTIGTGYADLGSLLMRSGIPYDSDEGRAKTSAITALLTGTVYETSIEMAEKLGTFVHYNFNREPMLKVMETHRNNLEDVAWGFVGDDNLKRAAYDSWNTVIERGGKHGFRNAQGTVLAPTGTIIYLMAGNTTGEEPAISLQINKDLAGGGTVVITNRDVPHALENLGYNIDQIKEISRFIEEKNTVRGAPHLSPDHYSIFDTAFGNSEGEGSIDFEGHVRMVAAAQPFISGAISKTNNLPEYATVKDVYDGYLLGNQLELKALSIFRSNSKPISPLNFGDTRQKKYVRGEKEDLPLVRNAREWEVSISGTPIHVIVSEYENGKPGQITFLSYKTGSDLGSLLTTSGILASRSMKRGMTAEDVAKSWLGHDIEPKGLVAGHPYIKMANSPLDFAAKLLLLEYMGQTDFAEDPESVDMTTLRGFQNGAFRTYEREQVDSWNMEQVLKDPEYGGFVENKKENIPEKSNSNNKNIRGATCNECGRIMTQTAPNCYACTCGERIGGCGA